MADARLSKAAQVTRKTLIGRPKAKTTCLIQDMNIGESSPCEEAHLPGVM